MNLEQRRRREAEKAEAWSKLSEKDRCLILGGVYQPPGELTALGRFRAAQCEGK